MCIASSDITGLILAGGRGSRMGGVDKGLQLFNGIPLVEHALHRLTPQVGCVAINANRNLAAYRNLGLAVWSDEEETSFNGPLSGFLSALTHATTPYILTVACDTPLFPSDLAQRLGEALCQASAENQNARMAMAVAPDLEDENAKSNETSSATLKPQPTFCLMSTELRHSLRQFMQQGGRKIGAWAAQQACVQVAFNMPHDLPQAFTNLNTLQELQALESKLNRI